MPEELCCCSPSAPQQDRGGGSRSPGLASPSAIARRIAPATWSWRVVGSEWSILTRQHGDSKVSTMASGGYIVLTKDRGGTAVAEKAVKPDAHVATLDSPEALIEEARQHQRRRRLWVVIAVLAVASAVIIGLLVSGGSGPLDQGEAPQRARVVAVPEDLEVTGPQ